MTQTVGILTKNRPEAFRHCVESLRHNASLFGRSIRLVVSDDSSPDIEVQNCRTLLNSQLSFTHCNRQFKAQYAAKLGPTSITNFALMPDDSVAMGAARNFLMLFLAGQSFVMLDDDMECKFASVPEANPKLRYSVGQYVEFQHAWAWHGGELHDVDFLASHQRLLGGYRVALTVGGSVGDSGMCNSRYILMNKETMKKIDSPETLNFILKHRQLLCSSTHPTIVRWVDCTGMNMGLDARVELPPFLPVQRGEDTLFGLTLGNCTDRLAAYCNYAMHHTAKRQSDAESELCTIASPMLSTFIVQILVWANPHSCEAFGQKLREIATASEFPIYADFFAAARRERLLRFLDDRSGLPDYATREIDRLADALKTPRGFTPLGMGVEEFRLRLNQFGQLMCAWPEIFHSAKALRKGIGVSNGE